MGLDDERFNDGRQDIVGETRDSGECQMSSRACFRGEDDPKLVSRLAGTSHAKQCVGPLHRRGRNCCSERGLMAEIGTAERPGGSIRLQQAQQAVDLACWRGSGRGGERSCGNERDSRKKRGQEYRTHFKRVTADAGGKGMTTGNGKRGREKEKSPPMICLINAKPASSCHDHE